MEDDKRENFKSIMARFNSRPQENSPGGNTQPLPLGVHPPAPSAKPSLAFGPNQPSKPSSETGGSTNSPLKHTVRVPAVGQNVTPPLGPRAQVGLIPFKAETGSSNSLTAHTLPSASSSPRHTAAGRAAQEGRYQSEFLHANQPAKPKATEHPLNTTPKPPMPRGTQNGCKNASVLRNQRSISENTNPRPVRRKPLLSENMLGLKPPKPKRPPTVDLEKFRERAGLYEIHKVTLEMSFTDSKCWPVYDSVIFCSKSRILLE
nr:PREDICTED: cortactin-binding protein 2-like [Latimeria chalumnae]|eukprot:XP_014340447.1 PREDICTED: cortactin-binding protein 2-like [Latimeria chalumnae]